jgi:hypothetical protein
VTARLAAFWASKRRADPDDREREPVKDTPEVQELRAALAEAERAAMPFAQRAAYHEEQIAGLLRAPAADPAVLAVIAEALVGGHIDNLDVGAPTTNSGSMATAQPAQGSDLKGGSRAVD